MKKGLIVLSALIGCFLLFGLSSAQMTDGKYRLSASAVGAFPIDDIAGISRAGLGMAIQIDREVGKHWTAGIAYYATKIWGTADYGNFQINAYDLTTKYYTSEIGAPLNIYILINSGWSYVELEDSGKDGDFSLAIGGGIEYLIYSKVALEAGFTIRKSGDRVDSVNPHISLVVPVIY